MQELEFNPPKGTKTFLVPALIMANRARKILCTRCGKDYNSQHWFDKHSKECWA